MNEWFRKAKQDFVQNYLRTVRAGPFKSWSINHYILDCINMNRTLMFSNIHLDKCGTHKTCACICCCEIINNVNKMTEGPFSAK